MAYQNFPTVNDQEHIIDHIETFATANGWTIEESNASPRSLFISRSMGGEVYHFSFELSGVNVLAWAYTGFQSGKSTISGKLNTNGSTMQQLHIFGGATWMHIVAEVGIGLHQMLMIGRLDNFFALNPGVADLSFVLGSTGQAYTATSGSSSYAYDPAFFPMQISEGDGVLRVVDDQGVEWKDESKFAAEQINSFLGPAALTRTSVNGYRPMIPFRIYASTLRGSTAKEHMTPVGDVPGTRLLEMSYSVNGVEETIGSDVWKRFFPPYWAQHYTQTTKKVGFAFLK